VGQPPVWLVQFNRVKVERLRETSDEEFYDLSSIEVYLFGRPWRRQATNPSFPAGHMTHHYDNQCTEKTIILPLTISLHKYEEFEFFNFTKRRREKKKKGRRLNLPDVLAAVQRGEVVGVLWTLFGFGEDREVGTEQQISEGVEKDLRQCLRLTPLLRLDEIGRRPEQKSPVRGFEQEWENASEETNTVQDYNMFVGSATSGCRGSTDPLNNFEAECSEVARCSISQVTNVDGGYESKVVVGRERGVRPVALPERVILCSDRLLVVDEVQHCRPESLLRVGSSHGDAVSLSSRAEAA
jgi:hypothetical protein